MGAFGGESIMRVRSSLVELVPLEEEKIIELIHSLSILHHMRKQ